MTKPINHLEDKLYQLNRRMFIAKYLHRTKTLNPRLQIIDTRYIKKTYNYEFYHNGYDFIDITESSFIVFRDSNIVIDGYSEPCTDSFTYFFTSDFETSLIHPSVYESNWKILKKIGIV